MKQKLSAFSRGYATALKNHLKLGPRASLQPARRLGRQAVALGLDTQQLARIHGRAPAIRGLSKGKNELIKRAEIFLAEAIMPIEQVQRAALKTNIRLNQENKTLDQRTVDLAANNRSLKQNIAQRKTVERALRKSGGHCEKLLAESHRLQKHLQQLTHRILSAQENGRKKISHNLQDEIAQTLLGINVRLLTLKSEAAVNSSGFKKEITCTQQMVKESVQSINRFARKLNIHQKT